MDVLLQDIRSGLRQLFRQRGSSIVAVLTLALGIGLTTAIFSVIDAAMLRPLPYPDPEQLVYLGVQEVRANGEIERPATAMADMRTLQEATDVFSAVAGWGGAFRGRIAEGPQPERIQVLQMTEDYLAMHGVAPALGRPFTRADTDPGSPLVALLGYGYWRTRYGGRADIVGQTISLDGDTATIVGVMPAGFESRTPLALPLRIAPAEFARRGTGRVAVYGRLRPDVTIEQARAKLAGRLSVATAGSAVIEVRPWIESRLESLTSGYRRTIRVIAGAVALVLLIAAVNVSGLLLARGAARQPELAVRASLGAARGRLVRQLLTESAVLAVPAAIVGVLLAWLSLDLLVANIPLSLPADAPVTLNLKVLAWTAAALVPLTLICGMVPALRLSRVRIGPMLAHAGRQGGSSLSRRGGQLLMAAEVALAVILVAGAGLMLRSFSRISAVDLGFRADRLTTMEVLPLERSPAAHKAYYTALLQQVRTIPGVASAGMVDNFPLGGGSSFTSVVVAGKSHPTNVFDALPGYFETIGVTLRDGRMPTDADYTSGFRGVVINESAARKLFPGGSAVGRDFIQDPGAPWTVIGVIADLRHGGPLITRSIGMPQIFFPFDLTGRDVGRLRPMLVVVRTSGAAPGLADQLRRVAQSIGPRVLVERIRTGEELFTGAVITPRRRTVLLGLLGAFGLALALVGVFSMTAYSVARRTSEIGVRMAFGARPRQVVKTMVRDSAVPIVLGTVLGTGAAILASRTIESFLFETAPTDPVTLAAVAITLATTGCLAALVPALRAAKVDPVVSLRAD